MGKGGGRKDGGERLAQVVSRDSTERKKKH